MKNFQNFKRNKKKNIIFNLYLKEWHKDDKLKKYISTAKKTKLD